MHEDKRQGVWGRSWLLRVWWLVIIAFVTFY